MEQRPQMPKSGEGDSEENVAYGEVLDNAKKGKKETKSDQNDSQDFYKSDVPGKKGSSQPDASQDESQSWRSVDSPLQTSAPDKKNIVESSHQKRGGIRSGGNLSESEAPKGRHEQQISREEGVSRRSTDSPVPHDSGGRRSSYDSPRHSALSAGDTPKRATRQNAGSDRSIEPSPLHPQSQGRFGGQVTSSPSWERKVSSEGSHGLSTSTPGRSRLRSVTRGDETPEDHGPAVPEFGKWDDNDPASAEGFTQIFTRVQEEKQTGGGNLPMMQSESLNTNGQRRDGYDKSMGCFCIPWGKR